MILLSGTGCLSVIVKNHGFLYQGIRYVHFINQLTADRLWGAVTGVSNAGRKRGRAKGRMRRPKDSYKGKTLGKGYSNHQWPGLNAPVSEGGRLLSATRKVYDQLPKTKEDAELTPQVSAQRKFSRSIPALQRGWSGSKFPGQSAGPPDPVGDYIFEGFDSRILEFKMVSNMTGNLGRKMRFSCLVVTGNMNGIAGFAFSKSTNAQSAIRKAKNRAAQKLHYIERFENHTVFHDFYTKENKSGIYVRKQHKGFGLVCHRAIKTICHIIGIESMYAKVEGSTSNVLAITRAFFGGLREQETHNNLAERLKLHIVEFRKETNYMPVVIASPTPGTVKEHVDPDEDLEFSRLYYNGKVPLARKKKQPFFANFPSYKKKLDIQYKRRNQPQARLDRIVYGLQNS